MFFTASLTRRMDVIIELLNANAGGYIYCWPEELFLSAISSVWPIDWFIPLMNHNYGLDWVFEDNEHPPVRDIFKSRKESYIELNNTYRRDKRHTYDDKKPYIDVYYDPERRYGKILDLNHKWIKNGFFRTDRLGSIIITDEASFIAQWFVRKYQYCTDDRLIETYRKGILTEKWGNGPETIKWEREMIFNEMIEHLKQEYNLREVLDGYHLVATE